MMSPIDDAVIIMESMDDFFITLPEDKQAKLMEVTDLLYAAQKDFINIIFERMNNAEILSHLEEEQTDIDF